MSRVLVLVLALLVPALAHAGPWKDLGDGLEFAQFDFPEKSSLSDSRLSVLRIDPARAKFVLLSAHLLKSKPLTARQWADRNKLRAVINAGMFVPDLRPVDFMRVQGKDVRAKLSSDRTLFAFDPREASLPASHMVDRECEGDGALAQYASIFQGIRMIDCKRHVVWGPQLKKWSIAAMAEDGQGRVLFLHSRSPYPVNAFARMLLDLPLDVRRAMYLEGGPEATLFVRAAGFEKELLGSYETLFFEDDSNVDAWALPNVLAVQAR